MRRIAVLAVAALSACATLGGGGREGRATLWRQAHDAYATDSLRVAAAAFQRLVTDHPGTREAHEARFFLGVLALEPRSGLELPAAAEQLNAYLAEDSLGSFQSYHQREARSLLRLTAELRRPCGERALAALRCDAPGSPTGRPAEPAAPVPADGAEAARLRREIAERDETIRRLRDELERIRNTLAPRRTPR